MCGAAQHLNLAPMQVRARTVVLGSENNLCSVSQAVVPEQCQGAPPASEGALLRRLPKLVKRMRKMCLVLMKGSPLPCLVEGLDQFTGGCTPRLRGLCSLRYLQWPGRVGMRYLCPSVTS